MENDFLVSYLNSSGFYSGIIYWLLIVIILLSQKKIIRSLFLLECYSYTLKEVFLLISSQS